MPAIRLKKMSYQQTQACQIINQMGQMQGK